MDREIKIDEIQKREEQLAARLKKLEAMEQEAANRQKLLKEKEKAKKQVLLRLAPSLWNDLAKWAEEDFRSINGQIEYLLSEAVRKHKG